MRNSFEDFKENHKGLLYGLLVLALSIMLMVISFTFTGATMDKTMFFSYFKSLKLLGLNLLPILLLFLIVWFLSNRFYLAYFISSLLIVGGGIANRSKLTYRNDPLVMYDLTTIREGMMMAGKYELPITARIVLTIIGMLIIGLILYKFFDTRLSKKTRLGGLIITILIGFISSKTFYFDWELYNEVGDKEIINPWIEAQRYQSKGFVYPFLYSGKELRVVEPEGYDEDLAKEILGKYEGQAIPEDKKVNVIAIMLEAYNDFSKFDGVEVDEEVYKYYNELKENAVHGEIMTNIFAGGTINTERSFISSTRHHPKYRKPVNTNLWYARDNGYKVEGMHPITGTFYARISANEYMGYENFYCEENRYGEIYKEKNIAYLEDDEFFKDIIRGYEESQKEGKPYFNMSVTYQNHGPYGDEPYHEKEYLVRKEDYNDRDYNIINNYLYGIAETDKAIKQLIEYFEDQDEPVVVVLFGDHNPWLGEDNSGYKMLGIDLDLGNEEGFKNYYGTPYIMWANDSAKDVTGNDFTGPGRDISPEYLSVDLFTRLGWLGDEYIQFARESSEKLPVRNSDFYKEGENYTKDLSEEAAELSKNTSIVQYYVMSGFKDEYRELRKNAVKD